MCAVPKDERDNSTNVLPKREVTDEVIRRVAGEGDASRDAHTFRTTLPVSECRRPRQRCCWSPEGQPHQRHTGDLQRTAIALTSVVAVKVTSRSVNFELFT
jgi:hypothetical protein